MPVRPDLLAQGRFRTTRRHRLRPSTASPTPTPASNDAYTLAETTTELDCGKHGGLTLRQIHKRGRDGSRTSAGHLPPRPARRRNRLAARRRWRHENYFRYGRTHFALDALDDYTDKPDDPTRLVPNPAKTDAAAAVTAAEHRLADAETVLATPSPPPPVPAADPTTTVPPPSTPPRSPRSRPPTPARPGPRRPRRHPQPGPARHHAPRRAAARQETKLITHAIRMTAYNAETTLARLLREHYPAPLTKPAPCSARRCAARRHPHHRRHPAPAARPATAARRSRAIAGLCHELTATETRYPAPTSRSNTASKATTPHKRSRLRRESWARRPLWPAEAPAALLHFHPSTLSPLQL